jgi:hypothetical protein
MKTINFYVGEKRFENLASTKSKKDVEEIKKYWSEILCQLMEEDGFTATINYEKGGSIILYDFDLRGPWDGISIHSWIGVPTQLRQITIYISEHCSDEDERGRIYENVADVLLNLWPLANARARQIAEAAIDAADNAVRKFIEKKKELETESKWDETSRLMLDDEGRE